MAKKILSVFIAVLMVASIATMAISTASAESPSFGGGKIYWQLPDTWAKAANIAYAHVYGHDGTALYDWQTKNEKMKDEGNGLWSYEVPAGSYDLVTFSIDTGVQTTDTVLTDACVGYTAITDPDTKLENPMDSNKTGARTVWKETNAGVHLAITSIGSIIGDELCPTESPADFVAAFIKNYLPVQPEYVTADVLSQAMNKAGTTGEEVVAVLETYVAAGEFDMLDDAKTLLGVTSGSDNNGSDNNNTDTNNGSDNNNSNNDNSTTSSNNSSTGGTRTNSSTTSTTSSGTTTTGDSTPFVVLSIVLVAALGVAVVAAKKKVSE